MATYISHASEQHLSHLRSMAKQRKSTPWTVNKAVKPNNRIIFYAGHPVRGFVAVGSVTPSPLTDGKKDGWPRHSMTRVRIDQFIDPPLPLDIAREMFPRWKWLKMPLPDTLVPTLIASRLLEALDSSDAAVEATVATTLKKSAGFGTAEENAKVEKAAVDHVWQHFEANGFHIQNRQSDNCGYDLLCTKGRQELLVEVKGVKGSKPGFIITAREYRCAGREKDFRLYVVTDALQRKKTIHEYTWKQVNAAFNVPPIAYMGKLRKGK